MKIKEQPVLCTAKYFLKGGDDNLRRKMLIIDIKSQQKRDEMARVVLNPMIQ